MAKITGLGIGLLLLVSVFTRAQEAAPVWLLLEDQQPNLQSIQDKRALAYKLAAEYLQQPLELKRSTFDATSLAEPGGLDQSVERLVGPILASNVWKLGNVPLDRPLILDLVNSEQAMSGMTGEVFYAGLSSRQWLALVAEYSKANELKWLARNKGIDSYLGQKLRLLGVSVEFKGSVEGVELGDYQGMLWHEAPHPAQGLSNKLITPTQYAYFEDSQWMKQRRLVLYDPYVFRNDVNDWLVMRVLKETDSLPDEPLVIAFMAALKNLQPEESSIATPLGSLAIKDHGFDHQLMIIAGEKERSEVLETLKGDEDENRDSD